MATSTITLKVCVAWWVRLYMYTLAAFCCITRQMPDMDKFERTIQRGLSIKAD